MRRTAIPPVDPLVQLGAAELGRRIARREVSSVEVFEAHRRRIEEVNPQINAIVVPRLEEAGREAAEADRILASGQPVGPLHGVPITIKECFHIPGMPSTIGLTNRVGLLDEDESPHVTHLRAAGAIVLGKTNIPQLMVMHESDNPVYGCTNSPLNFDRTPGGSSGGEAAAVAAFCSPLGLGNDLGGSIRVPASWCGLFGFKPTSYRLTNLGTTGAFRGMLVMTSQAGPLARTAEDCSLMMKLLVKNALGVPPVPWREESPITARGMKIAAWEEDGYFPACATAKRAVREAAKALEEQGAEIEWIQPPKLTEAIELYYSIVGSDGGEGARRMSRGSKIDRRIDRMLWMAGLQSTVRWSIVQSLRLAGQQWQASLVGAARPRSTAEYWQLCDQLGTISKTFHDEVFQKRGIQAIISPPHALPALKHRAAIDVLPAASYAFHANLLGLPAGVIPWTVVADDETKSSATARDVAERRVEETLMNAEGLPVGVQIAAAPWRDDIVLGLMRVLEPAIPPAVEPADRMQP